MQQQTTQRNSAVILLYTLVGVLFASISPIGRLFSSAAATSQRSVTIGRPMQVMVLWYTNASASTTSLDADLYANKLLAGKPFVVDSNRGAANGIFELSLEGPGAHLYVVEPNFPIVHQTYVNLYVRPSETSRIFESHLSSRDFRMDLVARDYATKERLASHVKEPFELFDSSTASSSSRTNSAPQFDSDLYVFSVYEDSQLGTIVGTVRARQSSDEQRSGDRHKPDVRYASLIGADSNLFKMDPESGALTLRGAHLDRERVDSYAFVVEARNSDGASNFTRVMINVLDVNDNAPVFTQSNYDAVLAVSVQPLAGSNGGSSQLSSIVSFQQPLVVRANDADEPNTPNSQVAYEIIAGNSNGHFTIDSLSGAIYPTGSSLAQEQPLVKFPTTLPSILSNPIRPFVAQNNGRAHHQPTELNGREVEETTVASGFPQTQESPRQRSSSNDDGRGDINHSLAAAAAAQSANASNEQQVQQATDLLLGLETGSGSSDAPVSAAASAAAATDPARTRVLPSQYISEAIWSSLPPPVTTLVVRAHDFGIPLRSSTAKVNIYNPILSTRHLSVILNGTSKQLEQRRDSIERTFGDVVGAKAVIESIDALSDSSQLSVARIKLTVPQSNLVDLTDLSALLQALEQKPLSQQPLAQSGRIGSPPTAANGNQQQAPVTHYVAIGDRLIPAANITSISSAAGVLPAPSPSPHHYTDIQSFAMDASALERKLLIYIIIVGVCILALLVIWMVYSCSRESDQVKVIETTRAGKSLRNADQQQVAGALPAATTQSQQSQTAAASATSNKTHAKTRMIAAAPIANQLYGKQPLVIVPAADATGASRAALLHHQQRQQQQQKPLWFEPNYDRFGRASSAPSSGPQLNGSTELIGPLDGALYATIATGAHRSSQLNRSNQFFPNTIGYTENLSAILGHSEQPAFKRSGGRRANRKVAPLSPTRGGHLNEAFEGEDDDDDDDVDDGQVDGGKLVASSRSGARHSRSSHVHSRNRRSKQRHQQTTGVQTSLNASLSGAESQQSAGSATATLAGADESSLGAESVVLDSDQELLGFDSSGAPIIATHTGAPNASSQQIDPTTASKTKPQVSVAAKTEPAPEQKPIVSETKLKPASEKEAEAKQPTQQRRLLQRQTADETNVVLPPLATDDGSDSNSKTNEKKTTPQPKSAQPNGSDSTGAKQATGSEQKPSTRSATLFAASPMDASEADAIAPEPTSTSSRTKMKNGELLERQSIFAMTYSGVATDKLPAI